LERLFAAIDRFKDEITDCWVIDVSCLDPRELRIHRFERSSIAWRFSPELNALVRQEAGQKAVVLLDGVSRFGLEFLQPQGPLHYILVLETGEQVRGYITVRRREHQDPARAAS
jgi:hypothetical protein